MSQSIRGRIGIHQDGIDITPPPGPERHQKLYDEYCEKYGKDNADYLMETEQHWFSTYDRAAYVHLTVGATHQDKQYTKDCADWLKWNYDEEAGDPDLLASMLAGRWDNERFLVLMPGQKICMTGDDRIVTAADSPILLHVHSPAGEHTLTLKNKADRAFALPDLLHAHSLPLNTRCGQKGICEGCMVQLVKGRLQNRHTQEVTRVADLPQTLKACDYHIGTTQTPGAIIKINIPPRSTTAYKPCVLDTCRINVPFSHQPLCQTTDLRHLAIAVDVGTTTIAMMLIDLKDGKVLAKATAFNRQMHLGDDVLTRINLCITDPTMLKRMQHELVKSTFEPLIEELLNQTNAQREQLAGMTAAGNTTMLHLFAGVDPSSMGIMPFTPQFLDHRILDWQEVGLLWDDEWGESPQLHLLPGASAYVGADLVAGLLASGLSYDTGPSLLVDVGTNGEIIFKQDETLLGCATAAGPAFEGAGLKAGIRAGDGAVSHIHFEVDPLKIHLDVIGNSHPIGLCGSAYIDLLARGRACGLIDQRGHFDVTTHPQLASRIQTVKGHSPSLHLGHGLYVSEAEIARILQAKAAIAAGILTLLDKKNIKPCDISKLYLAGGFGMHVDLSSAIGCGLLPGFTSNQIELMGNTSLAGAYMSMIDRDLLTVMSDAASHIEVLELNLEPNFEDHFIDQLSLT
ncbi:DUF4445 domain-containing protein [bacterium AH-315-I18]|nr:DUF4445 domain-containing protein [bacterium AH-315-I18]